MQAKLVVFDAYGTLLDVAAAARRAAAEPGFAHLAAAWPRLADDWRRKQLEYTWLRAITGAHADFWQVTQDGLDWALDAAGLGGDAALRARLLSLYRVLDAFPEAASCLSALRAAGLRTAILSNGAPGMLAEATQSAGVAPLLDALLSVEEVGIYKPAAPVYGLVEARMGTAPGDVLFVSANGWDAAGATGFGFVTVWINRTGAPHERLPWAPAHVLPDLSGVPGLVRGQA